MTWVPDIVKTAARKLRQDLTLTEKKLWNIIRAEKIGIKFYRQKPIYVFTEDSGLDRYIIADFYAPKYKLVIEIDGSIHDVPEIYELDQIKEQLLLNRGFTIIRFTNSEIFTDLDSVIYKIKTITAAPCSLNKE